MTSTRPYLLRAMVDWINDNGLTPHIQVDARVPGVRVPASAVREGRITLNIASRAVVQLHMDNEGIAFQARFSGVPHAVYVPMAAVEAVYARENGQGMAFAAEEPAAAAAPPATVAPAPAQPAPSGDGRPVRPPHLRVIK